MGSTDPLITDIWRTGSGQNKRFGEPPAVADGDGIRRHPARTANTKAPAAAASPRVPARPPPIDSYRGEPAPRAALLATRFATLGKACSGHPGPRGQWFADYDPPTSRFCWGAR